MRISDGISDVGTSDLLRGTGFVDASGDAALTYAAGFACREPVTPIMGTLMFTIEGFDQDAAQTLDRWTVQKRLGEVGPQYGLVRRDGFVFAFPGKEIGRPWCRERVCPYV